jgi:predicted nucleic acid-binding protein
MQREKCRPFTTNVLVIETHTLLLIRSHHSVARAWLRAQPVPEKRVTEQVYADGRQLIAEYDDKDFSLADATSFVVMERLRTPWAFTFDDHFAQYGFSLLTA